MKLYHWPMSHNARKARALARHLGAEVEEIALSMQDKDHKAESFLAINPMGQVPAIKDGDYTVWEANAVLIYLAAQAPNDLLGHPCWPNHNCAGARPSRSVWQCTTHAQCRSRGGACFDDCGHCDDQNVLRRKQCRRKRY